MIISANAVERFISRCRPELGFQAAEELLYEEIQTARQLERRAPRGEAMWEIASLGCIAVVRDTRDGRVVVTVLRAMQETPQLLDDLRAEAKEVEAEQALTKDERLAKKERIVQLCAAIRQLNVEEADRRAHEKARRQAVHLETMAQIAREATLRQEHKQREKTLRHEANMAEHVETMRRALKVAVAALVRQRLDEDLERIRVIEPGYLNPRFWMEA